MGRLREGGDIRPAEAVGSAAGVTTTTVAFAMTQGSAGPGGTAFTSKEGLESVGWSELKKSGLDNCGQNRLEYGREGFKGW